jgi:hypothetical protein
MHGGTGGAPLHFIFCFLWDLVLFAQFHFMFYFGCLSLLVFLTYGVLIVLYHHCGLHSSFIWWMIIRNGENDKFFKRGVDKTPLFAHTHTRKQPKNLGE